MRQHLKPCTCHTCEKARWEWPCPNHSHNSFWKTVVVSKYWEEWEKENQRRMQQMFKGMGKYYSDDPGQNPGQCIRFFDTDECSECGWISPEHFEEFMQYFIKKESQRCADIIEERSFFRDPEFATSDSKACDSRIQDAIDDILNSDKND